MEWAPFLDFPDPPLILKLWDQKYWFDTMFLVITDDAYWATTWYVCRRNLRLSNLIYDQFLVPWDQIRMYLILSRIY